MWRGWVGPLVGVRPRSRIAQVSFVIGIAHNRYCPQSVLPTISITHNQYYPQSVLPTISIAHKEKMATTRVATTMTRPGGAKRRTIVIIVVATLVVAR